MDQKNGSHTKFLWLSIAASIFTIILKFSAYYITGSIGLFSDAIESFINLTAGIFALVMLTLALRPPDKKHPFGHHKAEYFASVTEGMLIFGAAITIGFTAVQRILNPRELDQLGFGLLISVIASAINLFTAVVLINAGKKYRSITLEADGKHLMTDVWTTAGVLAGLLLVKLTGWIILDSIAAIAVALNIIYTGTKLVMQSVKGLMDSALPEEEQSLIKGVIERYLNSRMKYHSLYTRKAASRNFISMHILMPGKWSVNRGHKYTKKIEYGITEVLPDSDIFIHIEPIDDPDSLDDYLENE